MLLRAFAFALVIASSAAASAQPVVQSSHIEANVPDTSNFDGILRRDLVAYFRANGQADADRVEYQLLRDAPTQSGISYPKYYAWVQPFAANVALPAGAVRLAAVERSRFEVTNFVTKSAIQSNRASVEAVFPAALVPAIVQRASTP